MKSLFKSKTFWFNVATGVLAIASGAGPAIPIIGSVVQSTGLGDAIVAHPAVAGSVAAAANIALRIATSQPVSISGGQ